MVTAKGIDRATPITGEEAARLWNLGYTFVGRYLSDSSWKRLTLDEVKRINKAGLYVVAIFQNANNKVFLFNREAGIAHAKSAVKQAESLGMPKDLPPIFFAVDFEARTIEDFIAIYDYFEAIVETMKDSGYPVGVYGSYTVCKYVPMHIKGVTYTLQTVAWSGGKVLENVNLYQRKCDVLLPDDSSFGRVDLLVSYGAGGGWKTNKK